MERRVLPYGPTAVLVECADRRDTDALLQRLTSPRSTDASLQTIVEVVPGARTLLLRLTGPPPAELKRWLLGVEGEPPPEVERSPVVIDVCYDGPDLAAVAAYLAITEDEVVHRHTSHRWRVAFCGFAPGFGYLQAANAGLTVPRRAEPRTKVPAGSVGLADVWSGIYPRPGPGGWQLIGTSEVVLFDLDRDPVALLRPGTAVSFRSR